MFFGETFRGSPAHGRIGAEGHLAAVGEDEALAGGFGGAPQLEEEESFTKERGDCWNDFFNS